ncbi:MAG: peptidase S10 [Phycisphaeraceae bacterium]|nr:MAG: peptidase S10 [Phycisphaeraceae bacterium]
MYDLKLKLPVAIAAAVALWLAAPVSIAEKAEAEQPHDRLAVTDHSIRTEAGELPYTATAGYMPMKTEDGELRANIFHIAYIKDGVEDPATRPITFVFNGGPGSSSVWLHMGTAGPRRVLMGDDDGAQPDPPHALADNPWTWLTATDLVFIDPVGTGYSRPAGDGEQADFSGLEEDIESVGDFIRLYITREQRWRSPKFLAGESYGTTRAAGLAGYLQNRHGMHLNGLMLISSVLNFQTVRFHVGNDLPYVLFLPTYTATAWYHERLPATQQRRPLRELLDEVESWTIREYMPALALGDTIDAEHEQEIVNRLAEYTGLDASYIRATNMRILIHRFTKELRRDERRTVGRLDSRYTGVDLDSAGERYEHDPSLTAITGVYTATLNDYVRSELEYENDIPYEILTGRVRPWSYATHENRYVNVGETLRGAMSRNPALKVFIASGYYDLATPHFATDYTFNTLGLEPELRQNVQTEYYESGHMMYVHMPSLKKLHADIDSFVRAASGQ